MYRLLEFGPSNNRRLCDDDNHQLAQYIVVVALLRCLN